MGNHSILLVEDDENDVFFVRNALQRSEIDAPLHVASDGQEAIEFLDAAGARVQEAHNSHPGLVLLDLKLPRRTGLDVLKWIRQESVWKTIIVIVLTSSTSEADMHEAYLRGANSYVIKPADATKLREFGQLLKSYWLRWNQAPPVMPPGSR